MNNFSLSYIFQKKKKDRGPQLKLITNIYKGD